MSEEIKTVLTPESWPIENVHPYENNAKIHTDQQVAGIAKSIRTYGWDQPIVVDGAGVIIKGHGRYLAARKLNMTHVPVVVRTDLTANEANASRVADNIVARGDHDTDKLQKEVLLLSAADESLLDALGLTEKELEFMTKDIGALDEAAIMTEIAPEDSAIQSVIEDVQKFESVEVPVARVLGFSKIPGSAAPTVASFMTSIEAETGKRGADAFVGWIEQLFARAEEFGSHRASGSVATDEKFDSDSAESVTGE